MVLGPLLEVNSSRLAGQRGTLQFSILMSRISMEVAIMLRAYHHWNRCGRELGVHARSSREQGRGIFSSVTSRWKSKLLAKFGASNLSCTTWHRLLQWMFAPPLSFQMHSMHTKHSCLPHCFVITFEDDGVALWSRRIVACPQLDWLLAVGFGVWKLSRTNALSEIATRPAGMTIYISEVWPVATGAKARAREEGVAR